MPPIRQAKKELQRIHSALRSVDLFSECSSTELSAIRSLTTHHTVRSRQTLMRQGDWSSEFFVIVEGHVEVEREGAMVASPGPGSFVGEIGLLHRTPRTATVTTATSAELLVASVQEFAMILEMAPPVARRITEASAQRRQRDLEMDLLMHRDRTGDPESGANDVDSKARGPDHLSHQSAMVS